MDATVKVAFMYILAQDDLLCWQTNWFYTDAYPAELSAFYYTFVSLYSPS